MNDFALNDGELDGQPEVWLATESAAQASITLAGGVNKARFVESLASMQMSTSLKLAVMAGLQSAAGHSLSASAWMPPSVRKYLDGLAAERLEGDGVLLRRAMVYGLSDVELLLDGDIRFFGPPRALFKLEVSASADARVSKSVQLDCRTASVILCAESMERVTPATMLESRATQWLHTIGALRRDSYSPSGIAQIAIESTGEIRTGGKVKIDGTASVFIELYSRGILGGIRYRYLSGEAALSLLSSWSPEGHPEQPDFYIPAQDERVLFATRDDRTLEVPMEVA